MITARIATKTTSSPQMHNAPAVIRAAPCVGERAKLLRQHRGEFLDALREEADQHRARTAGQRDVDQVTVAEVRLDRWQG
ncbi:hypothetical protein F0L68_15665 [Solihabitans fulvus]|uniref:Uncharacterized protein n=1 Tax=Solihabitans fulvus TaxID=1892852 RepID=A0A5B2XEL5_9PSEU|nr:hypothetical protein [Solihabitans fulvus]KAA2261686.1 hypothetical protein F0L68_15665 [Solihabitans fulvus]